MEEAEYKVKERQFHEKYLQGRRPKQYDNSVICLAYLLALFFGTLIILGLYKAGEFCVNLLKYWN